LGYRAMDKRFEQCDKCGLWLVLKGDCLKQSEQFGKSGWYIGTRPDHEAYYVCRDCKNS